MSIADNNLTAKTQSSSLEPNKTSKKTGISALILRYTAIFCMLCDHIGYKLTGNYPALIFLRHIGRLAFPIFIFLIVNGYRHTHSKTRYALRLAAFAVISQIPFSLFFYNTPFHSKGNVFFTLFFSLLCVWAFDVFWKKDRSWKFLAPLPAIIFYFLYFLSVISSDYGMKGIFLALVFYLFDGKKTLTVIGTFAALYSSVLSDWALQLVKLVFGMDAVFKPPTSWIMTEVIALLALIPIFLYSGKKGRTPKNKITAKLLQIGFYVFYPAHLFLLWLVFSR